MPESVMEYVFSKALSIYLKWKWQSLRRSLYLEKLRAFSVNGNDGVLCQNLL